MSEQSSSTPLHQRFNDFLSTHPLLCPSHQAEHRFLRPDSPITSELSPRQDYLGKVIVLAVKVRRRHAEHLRNPVRDIHWWFMNPGLVSAHARTCRRFIKTDSNPQLVLRYSGTQSGLAKAFPKEVGGRFGPGRHPTIVVGCIDSVSTKFVE